jgi:hypothetical protein
MSIHLEEGHALLAVLAGHDAVETLIRVNLSLRTDVLLAATRVGTQLWQKFALSCLKIQNGSDPLTCVVGRIVVDGALAANLQGVDHVLGKQTAADLNQTYAHPTLGTLIVAFVELILYTSKAE